MASRDFLKHVVSTSEPVGSTLGDEYYNPSSNKLFKRLAVNGTSVQWVERQQSIAVQSSGVTVATGARTINFPGATIGYDSVTDTITIQSSGIPGGANTNIQFNNSGAFAGSGNLTWNNGTQTLALTGFLTTFALSRSGNINAPTWTTTSPVFNSAAALLTDTTGSGTIALKVGHSFLSPNFASSSLTTITDAANLYVNANVASTNTTITNNWALYVAGNQRITGTLFSDSDIQLSGSRVIDYKNTTAQWTVNGGGVVTWNGSSVLWNQRILVIPVARSIMGSAGYFEIACPTSGTVTYFNSVNVTTTVTCTAAGIPLAAFEALYYELNVGGTNASEQTRFRVVNYLNSTWRPSSGWILLASVNGDGTNIGHLKWLPGQVNLPTTGSTVTYNTGTGISSWAAGSGTVTAVSVASANGFAGTSSGGATPALTLTTSITGMLRGNGTAISAASAGTDFLAPSGTFNLGTTSITFNRTSGAQSLTGINIDGSAGTAGSATSSTFTRALQQTDGTTFLTPVDPRGASGSRTTVLNANQYSFGLFSEFKNSSAFSFSGTYTGLLTYASYNGTTASTGDPSYQLAFHPNSANATANPRLKFRAGIDSTWGAWGEVSHTGVTNLNIQHNSIGAGEAAGGNAGQISSQVGSLGTTLNTISNPHIFLKSTQSNQSTLRFNAVRDSAGSDWTTAGTRIQLSIDSTFMAYQQFNGTNVQSGIEWGSGTNASATGVPARMRLDSAGSLRLLANVTSTSTTSGTVIVTGGVGMSENLYVGGLMVQGGLYSSTTRTLSIALGTESWVRLATLVNRCAVKILIGAGSNNSEEESEIEILGTYTLGGTQIHVKRQTYNPHLREVRVTQAVPGGPKVVYVRLRTTEFAPSIDWRLVSSRGVTSIENVVETPGAGESVLVEQLNANINNAINTLTNTTASTSATTGALVVTGGAGISGDVYTGGQRIQSIGTGLTATGNTQGTALLLARQINNVTVVTAGTNFGVRLPVAVAGMRIIVRNSSAVNLSVYPNTGAQIQTLGANVAMVLVAATMLEYVAVSATQWYLMNNVYA